MNKGELVDAVAAKTGVTKKNADAAVTAVFEAIAAALGRGEEVRLAGFGSFSVRQRTARTGRNPRTGEEINIPAAKAAVFRPAAQLKEAVAGK